MELRRVEEVVFRVLMLLSLRFVSSIINLLGSGAGVGVTSVIVLLPFIALPPLSLSLRLGSLRNLLSHRPVIPRP